MSENTPKQHWFVLKEDHHRKQIMSWYYSLHGLSEVTSQEDEEDGKSLKPQRGVRVGLTRCSKPEEALLQPGFFSLSRRLENLDEHHLEGLAIVAVILATAKIPTKDHLPSILGQAKDGTDTPTLSELRYQRLLASGTPTAFLRNLQRAVTQAGMQANPLLLADSILHWEAERNNPDWYLGNRRFQYRWAKDYYAQVFKYQKAA